MSTTYSVRIGDTFARIARITYGDDAQAFRIQQANTWATEPLTPGTVLAIPALPGAPQDRIRGAAAGPGEVVVAVNNRRFRFWESVQIVRSMDSIDTFQVSAPFEPDRQEFRESFRPFSFAPVTISVGGAPLFTGTMVNIDPVSEPQRRYINANGYALPGVLSDCTAPASAHPIEFNTPTGLRDIAEKMVAPFGLQVEFTADEGATFEQVGATSAEELLPFLADLARQRGLLISNTPEGALLFQQEATGGQPVAVLNENSSPVTGVTPVFDPQSYYSEITGLELYVIGTQGGSYTVKNPVTDGVIRPLVFVPQDTQSTGIERAVRAKAGRMFANMVAYTLTLNTWYDPAGNLWAPNTTIRLTAPGAMIYNEYEFLIRTVELNRVRDSETATLTLVLPGVLNGELPEALPWDS